MIFAGIDQALSTSGVALLSVHGSRGEDHLAPRWTTKQVHSPTPSTLARAGFESELARDAARMASIAKGIVDVVPSGALVVIEALAYDAHDTERMLAGLRWMILDRLRRKECRIRTVAPNQRAAYASATHADAYRAAKVQPEDDSAKAKNRARAATNRAKKAVVVEAIRAQHPDAVVEDDNVADAVALAALGARMAGFPVEVLTGEAHTRIAKGLAWRWA